MKRFRLWPGFIFALIALNFLVVGVTLYFAVSDPNFRLDPRTDHASSASASTSTAAP